MTESRGKDGKQILKYGRRILAAARLAGTKTGVRSRRFDGSRIGRGASMGRLLSSRDRFAGYRGRRAAVKASLIRLKGKASQAARAHMRYIQRDGVTREGLPGELYARRPTALTAASFWVAPPVIDTSSASSSRPRTAPNITTSSLTCAA